MNEKTSKKEGDISHLYTMIKSTESTAITALGLLKRFSTSLVGYEDTPSEERDISSGDVIHQSLGVVLNIRENIQEINSILYRLLDELPTEDTNEKFLMKTSEYQGAK